MRSIISTLKSAVPAVALLIVTCFNARATTYTAILSGNFNSTASWSGGIVPTLMAGDDIVIPLGITINLNQDLELNSNMMLTVNGALTGGNGNFITLAGGTLSGSGTIMVDSMYNNFTSGFNFTGDLTADIMTSANATFATAADIIVNEVLVLDGGTTNINGGTFGLGTNATIIVSGGVMMVGSGSLDLSNTYDVAYINTAATAGIELTGTGLSGIYIDVPSTLSVSLSQDLTMNGMLYINKGTLNLNNRNLTIGTNGDITITAGAYIASSSNSDITISSSAGLTSTLVFAAGGNTVDDLTLNLGNGSATVMIGSNLSVTGQLSLQKGRLHMGMYKLDLATGATVTGGSSNSYVVATNGGRLAIDVAANTSRTFHIGTATGYMPAIITLANTSAASKFSLGVDADVKANGTTGTILSATQPMINATWMVESSATASVNATLEVMWNTASEVNAFDRTKAYISHYTNAQWDASATAAATMNSNGMYSVKRSNLTTFSPFAVFDENTSVSVGNVAAISGWSLSPNPATDMITIQLNDRKGTARANIYNVSGQLVTSTQVTGSNNSVDVSRLNPGVYYVRIDGAFAQAGQKFIKQ